jgi:hypothetical protein
MGGEAGGSPAASKERSRPVVDLGVEDHDREDWRNTYRWIFDELSADPGRRKVCPVLPTRLSEPLEVVHRRVG